MNYLENHDSTISRQGDDLFSSGEGSDHGEDIIDTSSETVAETLGGASDDLAFGKRLTQAREHHGHSIETCGQALHLPVRLLQQIEQGDYEGVDYSVYLRSYLCKYGRHLGIDQALIDAELERIRPREPALVSAGGVSKSHRLIKRYTTASTYIVLTAVIVVPLIWLGVHGGLGRDMAQLAPLEKAPVAVHKTPEATGNPAHENEQPLQASMAPFSAMSVPSAKPGSKPTPQRTANTPAATPHPHTLAIRLDAPSWVEITGTDGQRIEYSLLPAGTHRTYDIGQPLDVSIGNADGASVRLDGKPLALSDFRHNNVAHVRISLNDGQVQPTAM
jgi:cytoskeleton protein RodZ